MNSRQSTCESVTYHAHFSLQTRNASLIESDHIFVLCDQNGDLVGRIPFQKRRIVRIKIPPVLQCTEFPLKWFRTEWCSLTLLFTLLCPCTCFRRRFQYALKTCWFCFLTCSDKLFLFHKLFFPFCLTSLLNNLWLPTGLCLRRSERLVVLLISTRSFLFLSFRSLYAVCCEHLSVFS